MKNKFFLLFVILIGQHVFGQELPEYIKKINEVKITPQKNGYFYPQNLIDYCGINFEHAPNYQISLGVDKFITNDSMSFVVYSSVDYLMEADKDIIFDYSTIISSKSFWILLSNISTKNFFQDNGYPTMFFVKCDDGVIRAYSLFFKKRLWYLWEYPISPRGDSILVKDTQFWSSRSHFFR